jgi:hypothetical protein
MPTFSLRRLFASITLIAIGCAIDSALCRNVLGLAMHKDLAFVLWAIPGALIGAGILLPFRLLHVGAVVGTIVRLAVAGLALGSA